MAITFLLYYFFEKKNVCLAYTVYQFNYLI